MTTFDLLTDLREGVVWWHIAIEGSVAVIALIDVYFLIKRTFVLKKIIDKRKRAIG